MQLNRLKFLVTPFNFITNFCFQTTRRATPKKDRDAAQEYASNRLLCETSLKRSWLNLNKSQRKNVKKEK